MIQHCLPHSTTIEIFLILYERIPANYLFSAQHMIHLKLNKKLGNTSNLFKHVGFDSDFVFALCEWMLTTPTYELYLYFYDPL
jgi:hypothetical protein